MSALSNPDLDKRLNKESCFQHPPIDPNRQVRLLVRSQLQQQQQQQQQQQDPCHTNLSGSTKLQLSFRIIDRGQLPTTKYLALSYTWGSATTEDDVRPLEVDGIDFYARTNVVTFLQAGWAKDHMDEDVLAWPVFIDAICINQLDVQEKQEQVAFMDEVYQHADEVISYVGQFTDDHKLCWYLTELRHMLHTPLGFTVYGGATTGTVQDVAMFGSLHQWEFEHLYCFALLSGERYWTRAWVVQEILLARRITLVYGSHAFEWGNVASLPRHLVEREVMERHPHRNRQPLMSATHAEIAEAKKAIYKTLCYFDDGPGLSMFEHRAQTEAISFFPGDLFIPTSPKRFTLSQALSRFGQKGCHDPRDKLYSILGILHPRARSQIVVAYDRDVVFAFEQALRVMLSEWDRHHLWDTIRSGQDPTVAIRNACLFLRNVFGGGFRLQDRQDRQDRQDQQQYEMVTRKVLWELNLRRRWHAYRHIFRESPRLSAEEVDKSFDLLFT